MRHSAGLDDAFALARRKADSQIEPSVLHRVAMAHQEDRASPPQINVAQFPAGRARNSERLRRIIQAPSVQSAWFRVQRYTLWISLTVALAGLLHKPQNAVEHWALYWVASSFALAAIVLFQRLPLPSLALALGAAGWGGSLLKVSGLPIPNALFSALTAGTLWLVCSQYGQLPGWARRATLAIGLGTASLSPLSLVGVGVDTAWFFSFAAASVLLTQRMMALRSLASPVLALVFISFVPFTCGLVLNVFMAVEYGSAWSTIGNLSASLAPIGCVARAAWLARNQTEGQGQDEGPEEFADVIPIRRGIRL